MTDSASILSVGLNGFDAFFGRLTGIDLAVVGATSVESRADSSVESFADSSVESRADSSVESFADCSAESFADCSVDCALLSSAPGACAPAVPS